jgi:hypothetical protein
MMLPMFGPMARRNREGDGPRATRSIMPTRRLLMKVPQGTGTERFPGGATKGKRDAGSDSMIDCNDLILALAVNQAIK